MGIVGDHPEGGTRFDLTRVHAEVSGAPWTYEGSAFTAEVEHRVRATVAADGSVTVEDEASLPREVVQRAKLLLKTAWKHAQEEAEGAPPPRRVHRWRAS